MELAEVMADLREHGTAQNKKVYLSHGVDGEAFGVSYAHLKKLHRRLKTDHELALGLWATGNHDARVFACWVADGEKTTMKLLDAWAKDVNNHVLAYELVSLAQDTPKVAKIMTRWMARKGEWLQVLGWGVAARLVMQPTRGLDEGGVDELRVGELLSAIESGIHQKPNRARHNMNEALIAIGCRPKWKTKALRVAKRIGRVEVDYGPTSCTVTDAAKRINKTVEHYAVKGQLPTDGTAGKRRRHC